jgi:hypothetical protein
MKEDFLMACGSVTGREHRLVGKNNQDSCYFIKTDEIIIAIVCDGCSAGAHSEFGAQLGANMVAQTIYRYRNYFLQGQATVEKPWLWQTIRDDLLARIRVLALELGPSLSRTINDYFLFTILGTVITHERTIIFSLGDGLYGLNGEVRQLGPFSGNQPPYLGYGLVESEIDPSLLFFSLEENFPTDWLDSLVLGTDGVADFIQAEKLPIPGQEKSIGPLSQFWRDDSFFTNPDKIRRKLSLTNRDIMKFDVRGEVRQFNGQLPDDTTMIVIKHIQQKAGG